MKSHPAQGMNRTQRLLLRGLATQDLANLTPQGEMLYHDSFRGSLVILTTMRRRPQSPAPCSRIPDNAVPQ